MEFQQLLQRRRTIRLFAQKVVPDAELAKLIDAARRASCAANRQRLRYTVVRTPDLVRAVLAKCAWAALVAPRRTPQWGETAPAAFIAVATDEEDCAWLEADAGAAIMSMEFAACDAGLGCCWLGAIDREALAPMLGVKHLLYLVAVGFPAEEPVGEDIDAGGSRKYYLDAENRVHVPKLSVEALTTWK